MITPRNKTLTLNLSDREWAALEDMCQKKEMNKSQLIRHALAVYQSKEWPIASMGREKR